LSFDDEGIALMEVKDINNAESQSSEIKLDWCSDQFEKILDFEGLGADKALNLKLFTRFDC
jgi:hypothetical protein